MRWAGLVGYTQQVQVEPGIWEDVITEAPAMGEVKQTTGRLGGDGVLPQSTVTTSISIVTDGRRIPFKGMIYLTFDGNRWQVASSVNEPPRIVYFLGEEYHGPLPESASEGA